MAERRSKKAPGLAPTLFERQHEKVDGTLRGPKTFVGRGASRRPQIIRISKHVVSPNGTKVGAMIGGYYIDNRESFDFEISEAVAESIEAPATQLSSRLMSIVHRDKAWLTTSF